MNPIPIVSMMIMMVILGAALPWSPYRARGSLRSHHRDALPATPTSTSEARTKRVGQGTTPAALQRAINLSDGLKAQHVQIDGTKSLPCISLVVFSILLLIFDTETWLQRTLLLFLTLLLILASVLL